jgi:hypothetical protein
MARLISEIPEYANRLAALLHIGSRTTHRRFFSDLHRIKLRGKDDKS